MLERHSYKHTQADKWYVRPQRMLSIRFVPQNKPGRMAKNLGRPGLNLATQQRKASDSLTGV